MGRACVRRVSYDEHGPSISVAIIVAADESLLVRQLNLLQHVCTPAALLKTRTSWHTKWVRSTIMHVDVPLLRLLIMYAPGWLM